MDCSGFDRQILPGFITQEQCCKHIFYTEFFGEHSLTEFGMKMFIELEVKSDERLVLVTYKKDILSWQPDMGTGNLVGHFLTVAIYFASFIGMAHRVIGVCEDIAPEPVRIRQLVSQREKMNRHRSTAKA
jgi:hypothetical protein